MAYPENTIIIYMEGTEKGRYKGQRTFQDPQTPLAVEAAQPSD